MGAEDSIGTLLLSHLSPNQFELFFGAYCAYLDHYSLPYDPFAQRTLLELLIREKWFDGLVLISGGEAVGFCIFTESYSPVSCCRAYHINDMFVSNSKRGQGNGTMLLDELANHARRNNVGKFFVGVEPADPQVHRFYFKNDFKDASTIVLDRVLLTQLSPRAV
jgi:GNAT superfamily N-acetyltransferase